MKAEEILKKYGVTPDTKNHNYEYLYNTMIKSMKEYAKYIAKCTHDELINTLCDLYNEDGHFVNVMAKQEFVAPKELE